MNFSSSFACWADAAGPGLVSWSTYLWFLRTDLDSPKRSSKDMRSIRAQLRQARSQFWSYWIFRNTRLDIKPFVQFPAAECSLFSDSNNESWRFPWKSWARLGMCVTPSVSQVTTLCHVCFYYQWQILTLFKFELRLLIWHGKTPADIDLMIRHYLAI